MRRVGNESEHGANRHSRFSGSPRSPCNFDRAMAESQFVCSNASKHERSSRGSFCAPRYNNRDFLAISWNIWAICVRDEKPRGPLRSETVPRICIFVGYRRNYRSIVLGAAETAEIEKRNRSSGSVPQSAPTVALFLPVDRATGFEESTVRRRK